MERRHGLGMVVVAGAVALSAIGIAFAVTQVNKPTVVGQEILAVSAPSRPTNTEWRAQFEDVIPTSSTTTDAYTPPSSLSTTDALARKLFADYAGAREGGVLDADKINDAIAELAAQQAAKAPTVQTFTLADLTVERDVTITAYEGSLAQALKRASEVREYELTMFTRVVNTGSSADVAKLKAASEVYIAIRDKLIAVNVPEKLADEHLALVNAITALAAADLELSRWNGDALVALTAVNAFVAADQIVDESLGALYASIRTLKKA